MDADGTEFVEPPIYSCHSFDPPPSALKKWNLCFVTTPDLQSIPASSTPPLQGRCCIECAQTLQGLTTNTCPECGRRFNPDDPRTTATIGTNRYRRWLIGTSVLLYYASWLALLSSFVYSAIGGDWLLLFLLAIASMPFILLQFILLALPLQEIAWRRRLVGFLVPLVSLSICVTNWPVAVSLRMHRTAMAKIADRVANGEVISGPTRVGIFRFRQIRMSRGKDRVGFQLNGGAGGGMFVVRTPPGFVPEFSNWRTGFPLGSNHRNIWDNTNWTQNLGDGWFLVEQD